MNDRPEILNGKTYRIKPQIGDSNKIFNIIINDHDGRPYEMFLDYANPDLYQWINLSARCISTMLQRLDDPELVIKLMEEIFDPRGKYTVKGVEYKSAVAHIGAMLRRHVNNSSG